jgi:hypothetical protein
MTPDTVKPGPSPLWWPYLGFCLVLLALGARSYFAAAGISLLTAALSAVDLACIVGLLGYLLSMRWGRAWLWKIVLFLFAAKMALAAVVFAVSMFPIDFGQPIDPEQVVALFGLVAVLLSIPMMLALWRYAFKSASIWSAPS